jgi:hypothetical protein
LIAQKATIIIEHYWAHTAAKIGGLAKAAEVFELIHGNAELAEQILDFYTRKVYTDLRSGD